MKKYNITVNGISYAVEVEEAGGTLSPPAAAPSSPAAPAPKPAAKPDVSGSANSVTAPMPGTVLDVKVTDGQEVKAGQILIILEAMKMENEILAPAAATIDKVTATKGSSVNGGDVLVTFK